MCIMYIVYIYNIYLTLFLNILFYAVRYICEASALKCHFAMAYFSSWIIYVPVSFSLTLSICLSLSHTHLFLISEYRVNVCDIM